MDFAEGTVQLAGPGTGADGGSLSFNLWLRNVSCSALALLGLKVALFESSLKDSVTLGQMHSVCSKYILFSPRAF